MAEKTRTYVRDVPGGYERVTVERFKGVRPKELQSNHYRVRLLKKARSTTRR